MHISIIVSPKDCAQCHEKENTEFAAPHHSKAGRILGSLDNLLAEVIEGNNGMVAAGFPEGVSAAAVNGCWQCHGSQVKVLEDGELDPATWPNTGIGRINPDGSEGSCTAATPVTASRRPRRPIRRTAVSNRIDFVWFELWHHEGRRARHGVSMMGPDYTHWRGTYELAKNFYSEFIPELEALVSEGEHSGDVASQQAAKALQAKIDEVLNSRDHRWYLNKMDPQEAAQRKKAAEAFKARYK